MKAASLRILDDIRRENAVKAFAREERSYKKIFLLWFKDTVYDFCSVTSLHGYVHTIQKDYHPFERYLWIILSIFALIVSILLLWISWTWSSATPTTTVIESTNNPNYLITFPAITICNMNKISRQAALNIAKSMKRLNNTDITDEDLIQKFKLLLHFQENGAANEKEYQEFSDLLDHNNLNVNNLLEKLTPKCSDMLQRCSWKGSLLSCDSLFQSVNTSEGVCCSFNNYAFWAQNYDQKKISSIPKEPRRVTACGYQTGLSLLLKPAVHDYFGTDIASGGFRVMIHNTYDNADSNSVTKLVQSKSEAYLSIAPESTYSTDDVFQLPLKARNCLRADERKMDTFRKYSFINCVAECRSAMVYYLCGCVPYNLPNNGTMKKCKISPDLKCVRKNYYQFSGSKFNMFNDTTESSIKLQEKCNCLPDCNLNGYPSEISTGALVRDYSFNSISFFKDINNFTDETLIHVFFNDLLSTYYRKDMYQNWLGILAAFGGLLGLFLGFSLVTGFELVYFFTIRILFDKLSVKNSNDKINEKDKINVHSSMQSRAKAHRSFT